MSELANLQKQLHKSEETTSNTPQVQDDLQDEVMVDTLAIEAETSLMTASTSRNGPEREDVLNVAEPETIGVMNTDETVLMASIFEGVEFEEAPPMIQAMRLLGRLLDTDLAMRALEVGDDSALREAREGLLMLVEQGLTPADVQNFQALSGALDAGLGRLKGGKVESELVPEDVVELKSIVDSGVAAASAVHSEIWDQDDETLLAFQNLSREDADEVQEDLSTLDDETISPADRQKIQSEGVTSIEVEEVLVDFWEAAQNEEYEVVQEED
jgi:hypothetical protein